MLKSCQTLLRQAQILKAFFVKHFGKGFDAIKSFTKMLYKKCF